jgi:hypothetical protein
MVSLSPQRIDNRIIDRRNKYYGKYGKNSKQKIGNNTEDNLKYLITRGHYSWILYHQQLKKSVQKGL